MKKIIQPTLMLEEARCRRNIRRMMEKAKAHKLIFRPHFKTHQSAGTGNWFREEGVERICVSSVDMAIYFARSGWKDILIAFPVNILEIGKINKLAANIDLSLLIESPDSIRFLSKKLKQDCKFYIKIDTGYHRTGIDASDFKAIEAILEEASKHPGLGFNGFLVHSGNTYEAASTKEIAFIHFDAIGKLKALRKHFEGSYPGMILSIGDTPSSSLMEDFQGIDEIRPGNFVFYDVMQLQLGACSPEDLALAVACPVVAKHKSRNEIVIYGGSVHLSKDFILNADGKPVFGLIAGFDGKNREKIIENTYIRKLSQEHGIIKTNKEQFNAIQIGDLLAVLPVHSCLTANAMNFKYTIV